ncbi:MAG: nucleoside recognition domain-containing protein [Crocinitomicaceae bacterium]|nr:nucleoside recognition domain-containing protein [Crocinitomicaceae bacterium]
MLLNRLWIGLFGVAMIMGLFKLFFLGDQLIFKEIVDSLFTSAKSAFEMALYLTGALCLWMGIMQIGEKGGAVQLLTRAFSPLFRHIFPGVPKDHPAQGSMMMNFSANMLGLDNAATPLGLKAMNQLQELNPTKDTASNAQIMFLVLNTSGLTIIPVSILAYRSAAGSAAPTEVFLPILFATYIASMVGLIAVSIKQKLNLFHPTVLIYLGSVTALMVGLLTWLTYSPEYIEPVSNIGGNLLLFSVIILFIALGIRKKVNVYECFIEGAKGGFDVAIKIVPYLIAILVAVAVFRTSGAMELLFDGIRYAFHAAGVMTTEFVDALPTAFMKPFSGSAARGLMLETFENHGVDSFVGKLAATFQGSTETTFYVLAIYFGSVGVTKTRYAAGAGLLADAAGILAAIFIAYLFYHS